ncbi:MAG: hypothetical protein ACI8X5_001149 [Planctomycetota bacterium]
MSNNHPQKRAAIFGLMSALVYGLSARWLTESNSLGIGIFGVMSLAFLICVPIVMGVLSVLPLAKPTVGQAIVVPMIGVLLTFCMTVVFNWEGAICVIMAIGPSLILSAIAGLLTRYFSSRSEPNKATKGLYAVVLLPLLIGPLESLYEAPLDLRNVRSEIMIAATAEEVWEQIVEVPTIEEDEQRPALFTSMGFPRPLSAMVDRRALGGLRQARFEGGVLFLERITRFEPNRALEFTIDVQEELIPETTLDPHVTIGGPFFDVLIGAYEIEACEGGVLLHLRSELRVSTRFNFYASFWADLIMASIQDNILGVIKRRAEG